MACILITDVPIVKALEDQDSQDFEALWDILKTGAVRGYITPNDLQQLNQYLYDSVGADFAQQLLSGFRSVLDIYGEPDHPAIDLIIDGESVDELADEIPIRSVSDFLCIYELECLLIASPGEEIGSDSLFSSLSDMIEVLDGEDAFVSKALMDAMVPVDDAPISEESPYSPSKGAIRFASTLASSTTPPDEDVDSDNNSLAEQNEQTDQRLGLPPLSPVIQVILNSGNPTGNTKYDLRFASARSNVLNAFSHLVMAPTHGHQSMYDFNVDMFLMLGLIMQIATKDEKGEGRSSTVYQALLTHQSALSPTHRSKHDGGTIPSAPLPLASLQPDPEKPFNLTDSSLNVLEFLQRHQGHTPFYQQDGDRPFDLEFLDGHRSQKTGNEKKLAPGVKSLSASGPLAASSAAPHRMRMSHAPKPYRLDPFTQPSTLFSPNGESQTPQASFRSPQDPAIALASVPGVSTQMDPMLSDVQQSLTAFMGTKGITNNIRSLSSITLRQASANRLKSSLKAVQEKKQAVSDRLSSPGQPQSTSKRYNAIPSSDSDAAPIAVQAFVFSSDSGAAISSGNHADVIYVSDGNHEIDAGQGDDLIVVEAGVSTVTGGSGEDIFGFYREESESDHTSVEPDSNHIVITDFEREKDTIELVDIAPDELSFKQVGVNTHIFEGDDLLAVLESVDRDNLLTAGTFIYEPILDEMTFNIVIRWESHEIIQEFEQVDLLDLTGAGRIDPDVGISLEQWSDPWLEDIWIIDVGSDM